MIKNCLPRAITKRHIRHLYDLISRWEIFLIKKFKKVCPLILISIYTMLQLEIFLIKKILKSVFSLILISMLYHVTT